MQAFTHAVTGETLNLNFPLHVVADTGVDLWSTNVTVTVRKLDYCFVTAGLFPNSTYCVHGSV